MDNYIKQKAAKSLTKSMQQVQPHIEQLTELLIQDLDDLDQLLGALNKISEISYRTAKKYSGLTEQQAELAQYFKDLDFQNEPNNAAIERAKLTFEVVHQGLATAGPEEDSLHTKIVSRVERELIAQVMLACDNVQTKAAAKLGINRNTLHKKLKEYDLET